MRGGLKSLIGDHQMVMLFVSRADAAQNFNGLFLRGFFHLNRLEAAFECRIRFDMLAILVHGGRADHLQFTTR